MAQKVMMEVLEWMEEEEKWLFLFACKTVLFFYKFQGLQGMKGWAGDHGDIGNTGDPVHIIHFVYTIQPEIHCWGINIGSALSNHHIKSAILFHSAHTQ